MSACLWKHFFENDVEKFRQFLANAVYYTSTTPSKGGSAGASSYSGVLGGPETSLPKSPTLSYKTKSNSAGGVLVKAPKALNSLPITRADINAKDFVGCTLLHHIASSTSENALQFALVLLELPFLDLYVQDLESGWTALHRALYFGNVAIARALMDRDMHDAVGHSNYGSNHTIGGLIKIKDHEGNSPFDVYGATITTRIIRNSFAVPLLSESSEDEDDGSAQGISGDGDDDGSSAYEVRISPKISIGGDEIFAFGSNKNFNLGFGDEDDRQYPERLYLKRPVQLLQRFWTERKGGIRDDTRSSSPDGGSPVPASIQNLPIIIQDVRLSKLHSAILTNDPEVNLYTCGFGPGGRLGTGDEETRFNFVPILGGGLGGKKVIDIGLGQNHTVAVTSDGGVFSWGNNTYGQLGYNSPSSNMRDEEPIQLLPRQIFGPLKREVVRGVAASSIHTLVYTSSSLYTFGKNEGQLGLVDSDARSVVLQNTPRKVAASLFSTSINTVSAISRATICLLENHDVWIFANYGYSKVIFPLGSSSNSFLHNRFSATRYSAESNRICKITSGGETICAMSSMGDVFAVNVSQKTAPGLANASTTNPSKIRGALSTPQRIWTRNKSHMAVRDVDIGQDGAIIICTEAGSVWRRVKRAKVKDANTPKQTDHRPKDYKFLRVPGLTRVTAVRSNVFGAYAAVCRDCDVVRNQVNVESHMIWKNFQPLLSFSSLAEYEEDSETEHPRPRLWSPRQASHSSAAISRAVLSTSNLEETIATCISEKSSSEWNACDLRLGSTKSEVIFPAHECIVSGRSEIIRKALNLFRLNYYFSIPDVVDIEYDQEGRILIMFQEVDIVTVLNLVLYMYTDEIVSVWRHTKIPTTISSRYRSIRLELMKIAAHLGLRSLEQAVRTMTDPPKVLHSDMEKANRETEFYKHGDVEIELDGSSLKAHSAVLCQRCPFFEGLFNGRASGLWLSVRRKRSSETVKVDLRHIDPEIFKLVRRHIYADTGEELFDDIRSSDLESFLDLILEVLSVANELMLDRLSQCCQKVIGFYVSTRNICQLLNAVAPCSVTEFKKAGLEYICLNLESMLENHLLNELDDDLMTELDGVVRDNQLTCLPIAKSGRSDFELLAAYPELAARIERGKRARVDQIAFQYRKRHAEASIKGQYARLGPAINEEEDEIQYRSMLKGDRSNNQDSQGQKPPLLRTQKSADLMFEMDEAEDNAIKKGRPLTPRYQTDTFVLEDVETASSGVSKGSPWLNTKGKAIALGTNIDISAFLGPLRPGRHDLNMKLPSSGSPTEAIPRNTSRPWGSNLLTGEKLGMKDIMAQTSKNQVSNIAVGLSNQASKVETSPSSHSLKISQRERKKQQQQAQLQQIPNVQALQIEPEAPSQGRASPWQVAATKPPISLKDVIGSEVESLQSPPASTKPITPPLTMRQTIPGNVPLTRRTTSDHRLNLHPSPQQQSRSTSYPNVRQPSPQQKSSPSTSSSSRTHIQSIRHYLPQSSVEPSLQLSMADILSQQQTEKDIIRDAGAKRSLQEIQEEQAFQEWWDQESRKVKEEEERAAKSKEGGKARGRGKQGDRGRGRGRVRAERGSAGEAKDEKGRSGEVNDGSAGGGRSTSERGKKGKGRGKGGGV